jgi:serine/threonine protein kinase
MASPQRSEAIRIGPYVLGKTLGVGSTGRVKLGTHVETKARVAIKIIPKDALSQDDHNSSEKRVLSPEKQAALSKKIEREITIMKLVQHPHVMQLYDVYETDKELYVGDS